MSNVLNRIFKKVANDYTETRLHWGENMIAKYEKIYDFSPAGP